MKTTQHNAIVEFPDGTYGVLCYTEEKGFFKKTKKSYFLDEYGKDIWWEHRYIHKYCKFKDKEKAKEMLGMFVVDEYIKLNE